MTRRLALVLMAGSLLLAGCNGGGTGVSAAGYSRGVCGAVADWMQSIIDSIEELNARPAPADTEESQAGLLDYLDGILANTETMLTAVEATGVPDVDNGQAIAEGVVDGLRQVEATFRTARKRIAEAPTEDPEAYDATVQDALGPGFESGLADAQASLEALQSGELSVVGGNEPECQRIQELQRKLA